MMPLKETIGYRKMGGGVFNNFQTMHIGTLVSCLPAEPFVIPGCWHPSFLLGDIYVSNLTVYILKQNSQHFTSVL